MKLFEQKSAYILHFYKHPPPTIKHPIYYTVPSSPLLITSSPHPRPLPPTPRLLYPFPRPCPCPHPSLLLPRIQHVTQHIEAKLRELQTQRLEILFRLVPQHVRAHAPEVGYRSADDGVGAGRVRVDEAGVSDFGFGGRVYAVHFAVGEGFELLGEEGGGC